MRAGWKRDWKSDGRRRRTDAEKERIVAESLMPGVQLAEVRASTGRARCQIYDWRKRLRKRRSGTTGDIATAPLFAALLVDEPRPKPANACIDI